MMFEETSVSWAENIRLSQLAEKIFQGLYPYRKNRKVSLSKNVPAINIKNIVDGRIDVDAPCLISVDSRRNLEKHTVRSGDVVVTCRGTVLKSAVVPESLDGYLIASNIIAIRLNSNFEPILLSAFFQSPEGQKILLSNVRSSTMQIALAVSDIEKIEVPLIPAEIQKRLAGLVAASDNYYKAVVESANLRREIAHGIALKSFRQTSNQLEAKVE
ncbi:MAG TPA: restriction endonuclease subunit S [Nitrospirae bacterium]|nr:restriction endonuclease subunit S [Nitrospirota bacterium]